MIKSNNDYQTYLSYTNNARPDIISCPFCGVTGNYHSHSGYSRTLICYTSGRVDRHEITIPCVECTTCEHSHAILAPVIIPYSPFSFHFVISLLYDFITRKYSTVKALCLEYDISISTLYRIYHRFIEDRKLMLGMMEAVSTEVRTFLNKLANADFLAVIDGLLHDFYMSNHASFLQARCKIRLNRNILYSNSKASP